MSGLIVDLTGQTLVVLVTLTSHFWIATFLPPYKQALYKDNFATGNGELSKVIAGIAQREGNLFSLFHEH